MSNGYFEVIESAFDKEVKLKHGDFYQYNMTVRPPEGIDVDVQLLQKPDTRAPEKGDQIHGRIEETNFGYKLKKTQPEEGSSPQRGSSTPSSSQAQSQGNGDVQLYIIRQSSLKAAVDVCIANRSIDGNVSPLDVMKLAEDFTAWVQTGSLEDR